MWYMHISSSKLVPDDLCADLTKFATAVWGAPATLAQTVIARNKIGEVVPKLVLQQAPQEDMS